VDFIIEIFLFLFSIQMNNTNQQDLIPQLKPQMQFWNVIVPWWSLTKSDSTILAGIFKKGVFRKRTVYETI